MTPKVVSTCAELVQLLRERRNELDITHETIDDISGLQSGYTGKLLSPVPIKQLGAVSLGAMLGALALKIVRIELVEDPEQADRMRPRWTPRKRPRFENTRGARRRALSALLGDRQQETLATSNGDADVQQTTFQFQDETGGR
ncbi:hypothetical protein MTX26_15935 [Bradyrhizobium sp. ISRA443]|uniref:hypothetical protein n=1 Tax=unclassified Bradyrhizobium TaxID=2631580 RepID=UPI002478CC11|nr:MULTISPECIES: hypothetical protein [unclassified Bradyrhizobium]WGR91851.1 hypothetical protein MTX20_26505 [Bradyrhizobium sp. ISRA435]WGS02218.1 hypothetical protein MTX23_15945 [Bradyrhizobium sp. ISRA436]WGS09103.1 hypothetical protein MTX18_15935 [Bradyrhizobium sp. ISRA437]WGS15992.1 hypothetical protein MTX26_15935 [Bradyrhizobium sp. ISRA443]